MRHLFIINPAAGSRDQTGSYRRKIAEACEGKSVEYTVAVSQAPGHCRLLARQAAESGEEYRIYACGGDGTLNEVVSGVAGFGNVAVTMFAGGSGNDFIRIFSQPEAFRDLDRLLDAEEATFDLIRCNEDYSLNICSVGFDARVGTDVARYKRLPFLSGFRAYAVSAVVNTIRGVAEHYVIEVDGQRFDGRHTLVCACNGRYYGGGFNPVPEADPADGKLEVLLVKEVSRLSVAKLIGTYKAGKYATLPKYIRRISTDRIKIFCDGETPINLDGELRMAQTVDISVADEKLRFFYPRGLSWKTFSEKQTAGVL